MPLTCLLTDITNAPNALVMQDTDHDTNPSLVVHRTTHIMCPLLAAVSLLPKPNSNGTYLLAARDALPYAFLLSFPPVLSLAGRHSVLFAVHTVLPFAARVCYSLCPVFRLLLVRAPACRLLCPLPFLFFVPCHVAPFARTLFGPLLLQSPCCLYTYTRLCTLFLRCPSLFCPYPSLSSLVHVLVCFPPCPCPLPCLFCFFVCTYKHEP